MTEPDFEGARAYALARLAKELPETVTYHSLQHTRDDVVPAAERLAHAEGVNGEELMLLRTAAYFHDLGFVVRREEHEQAGAEIAAQVLPSFGYTPEQIEKICRMIMATRIPQSPTTLIEQILADADLDTLGSEHFWKQSARLRAENEAFDGPISDVQWYQTQVAFIENHRYWTASARALREARKQEHLAQLRKLLKHAQRHASEAKRKECS
ncbi:MAG: HD domain-containing protein [Roseiflexaceae bacterium]|nr:HD domain-containing protein [Roseiflexus sp.]MDW8214906.1 HD domain-containing protein [Roseiflexaceae bacterium]